MNTTTITQNETFNVSPSTFYKAFLSAEEHSAFTGSVAKTSDTPGAVFSAYDGYCFGKNIQLQEGETIIQSWCAPDENWPERHESQITLKLSGDSQSTKLEFIHENVPIEVADDINAGWHAHYWEPMRDYFDKKK